MAVSLAAVVMEAGKLDRRITIEKPVGVPDAFNESVPGWKPVGTVWASKKDVRDAERFGSQELAAEITTRFQIRWSSAVKDVDARHRILFDGRIYNIVAVKEIGRREGLEITGTARAERI